MLLINKQLGAAIIIVTCLVNTVSAQSIDSVRTEIYSKLKCCPCKESFEKCSCPEAKEMKAYIDALLENGAGKEEIYYKVAKKYSLTVIIDSQIMGRIEKRLTDEAGAKRPHLVLKTRSFDFGQLHKNQGVVKKTFNISNKGTDTLIINNIKTSCGCVSASLKAAGAQSPLFGTKGATSEWQGIIDAGRAGELEVALDLQHVSVRPGRLIREVSIFSNDPLYPETVIMLVGDVKD